MKSPIFIFSLPRSGSTLIQKVLMSHPKITSMSEPWILLPYAYAYKNIGVLSEYSHGSSYNAIKTFIQNLPNKEKDYYQLLNLFLMNLYSRQCFENEIYFLDKTPRYYFIIEEINKIFPDAKFIFLFRNPIHIYSSIITTFCHGRLKNLYAWEKDLNIGPKLLSNGFDKLKSKSYALKYEDFVENPEKYTQEICKYLELEYSSSMLKIFNQQNLKGEMGDLPGAKEYQNNISISSLNKWKKVFNTSFRKKLLRNYIKSLDNKVFLIQGYNQVDILKSISEMKVKRDFLVLRDIYDYIFFRIVLVFKLNLFFIKSLNWNKKLFIS